MAPAKSILWVHGGPDDGHKIQLTTELTLIGRASSNDIVVDDVEVSRQHAGIRGDRGGHWIEDLGSRNGTFVNGVQLEGEGKRLRDNDRIELGGATSVYWVFRELGATVSLPRPTSID